MVTNYTFQDWIDGKATIPGSCFAVSKGQDQPLIVELTEFSINDQKKIFSRQHELFDLFVSDGLNKLQSF